MKYVRECCIRLEILNLNKEIHGKSCSPGCPDGVKDIFMYIEEVQNMSLPKDVIKTMVKIYHNFLNLYKEIEHEIKEKAKIATGLKDIDDISSLFNSNFFGKWIDAIQVAQLAIIKFADHIEDFNKYYGAYTLLGDLKRPKVKSCLDRKENCQECHQKYLLQKKKRENNTSVGATIHYDPLDQANLSEDSDDEGYDTSSKPKVYFTLKELENSGDTENFSPDLPATNSKLNLEPCAGFCEKCKPKLLIEKEVLIDHLQPINRRHNDLAKEYLSKSSKQFYCSEGGSEFFNEMKNEVEKHYKWAENEIQSILTEDTVFQRWKDFNSDGRKLFYEKWKKMIFKINTKVLELADHVQTWWYGKINGFPDISIPMEESCNENDPCRKCVNKKPCVESQQYQDVSNSTPSTSGVKKLYSFSRSKVNFTMEDLENSSGEDDDDYNPVSMYL